MLYKLCRANVADGPWQVKWIHRLIAVFEDYIIKQFDQDLRREMLGLFITIFDWPILHFF